MIRTRVVCCGFDPVLVRGYVTAGGAPSGRALFWYLPFEVFEEYKPEPGDKIIGTVDAIYDYKAEKVAEPKEQFEWTTAPETGLCVVLPPEFIKKYKLTEFHFLEMTLNEILKRDGRRVELYPGKNLISKKFWPTEKMKLHYYLAYVE